MPGNKKRSRTHKKTTATNRTKKKKKEKKKRRLRGVAQLLAQNKVADDLSRRNLPQSIATNAHDKPRGGKGNRRYCEGGISSTYFRDTVIPDKRRRTGFPNKHQTNTKLGQLCAYTRVVVTKTIWKKLFFVLILDFLFFILFAFVTMLMFFFSFYYC